jgi:hypothetical protein
VLEYTSPIYTIIAHIPPHDIRIISVRGHNNTYEIYGAWSNQTMQIANLNNFRFSSTAISDTTTFCCKSGDPAIHAQHISVNVSDADGNITSNTVGITVLGMELNYPMVYNSSIGWTYDFLPSAGGTYEVPLTTSSSGGSGVESGGGGGTAKEPYTLFGFVSDTKGFSVPNATINLGNMKTTTTELGYYKIQNITTAIYNFSISTLGYIPYEDHILMTQDREYNIGMMLPSITNTSLSTEIHQPQFKFNIIPA